MDGIFPNRRSRLPTSIATIWMASQTSGDSHVDNAKGCPTVLRDSDQRCWNLRNHDVAGPGFGPARVLALESVCIHSADIRSIVSIDLPWHGMFQYIDRLVRIQ